MLNSKTKPTDKYLKTLLSYYEDEIIGEAYFYELANYFSEKEKLILLARVERKAAESIVSLLQKYNLIPRDESILKPLGIVDAKLDCTYSWLGFMKYIVQRYPGYLEEFKALEEMALKDDLGALKQLTEHEILAINFAKKEISGDPNSLDPLHNYLS